MMSLSEGMAAGQATSYFSREDYYIQGMEEGCSSWCGSGALALELSGPVGEEEFRALCSGKAPGGSVLVRCRPMRDPATGEVAETRRAGNDCTFSAPKSVSIAYVAGVEGMKEAHDAAVSSVLRHMEKHYCHYRPSGVVRSGEMMVAAKFDHATSRNIDPQLHSHVFIINATRILGGEWRANEPDRIYKDQLSLGLLYRQALAVELRARGFGVEVEDRDRMYLHLSGVPRTLVEHFSSRREEIKEQVKAWTASGAFPGVSHGRLWQMAALETRDPKREILKEDVDRLFENGFTACGTTMGEVTGEVEQARAVSIPQLEPVPAERVVDVAVREMTEHEAVLQRARLLDQAVRVSGGEHGVDELNAAIDGGTPGLVRLGQDHRGREFCTTAEMVELEARNLERIKALPEFRSVAPADEVERFLAGERKLTEGQRSEVRLEIAGERGCLVTRGDPGTAKTSTLKFVERFNEEVLRPRGEDHLSVNLAYTAKAAKELADATGRPACTLHSFEKANPASKFALQRANGEPPMVVVAGEKKLMPQGASGQVVFRVDEAGFLGARQADSLLSVMDELRASGVRVKLHLLGDAKQMQGIQAGNLMPQLQEAGEVDQVRLSEILRQRNPELLQIAKALNREDRPLAENAREAMALLEKGGRIVVREDPADLHREVVDYYLGESRKPSPMPERAGQPQELILVTTTNASRKLLNREIREARVKAGEIGDGKTFPVLSPVRQGVTVEGYRVGDAVHFDGRTREDGGVEPWGARLNTKGTVTSLDRNSNQVEVSYSFVTSKGEDGGVTKNVCKNFPAAEMSGRTTVFREEERNFAVGDRVVLLRNDSKLKLQNGTIGVVREVDASGRMRLDLDGRDVEIDLSKYSFVDHAYAVTIYKSQGATVDQSIMYAPMRLQPESRGMDGEGEKVTVEPLGRSTYNELNVALTRARFETRVFTNSMERFTQAVQQVDVKSSTLNPMIEVDRARTKSPQLNGPERVEQLKNLGEKIGRLQVKLKLENEAAKVTPAPVLPRSQNVTTPAVKEVGRQLELSLTRKGGWKLER
ncbi:MobF family relaxase [Geomonas anaerohicana]|uniref:Relaxase domain-containing protein n=1 Tax=Geomonas anaerohicana TaxID=2798583 RepID=A0ABS0YB82_9BACT|nr:MobF family relaxase [Geomonas anaerohicana]MBJ6749559.1 relaxase domain-containing protein [Geomonas anaerohicana]